MTAAQRPQPRSGEEPTISRVPERVGAFGHAGLDRPAEVWGSTDAGRAGCVASTGPAAAEDGPSTGRPPLPGARQRMLDDLTLERFGQPVAQYRAPVSDSAWHRLRTLHAEIADDDEAVS